MKIITAILTAGALITGGIAGHALFPSAVRCSVPSEPAGTTIAVDSHGNATSPWDGPASGTGMVCSPAGHWVEIPEWVGS